MPNRPEEADILKLLQRHSALMSGDICSSSNGLLPLCHHHGKFRGPLLNVPHHPEELCGAPMDQHPEELCTIDSLDIFLERSSES